MIQWASIYALVWTAKKRDRQIVCRPDIITNSYKFHITKMLLFLIATLLSLTTAHPTPENPSDLISTTTELYDDLHPRQSFGGTPAYLAARELFSGTPADLHIEVFHELNCPPDSDTHKGQVFNSVINHVNNEASPLEIVSYYLNRTLNPEEVLDFSANIKPTVDSPPPAAAIAHAAPAQSTQICGASSNSIANAMAQAGGAGCDGGTNSGTNGKMVKRDANCGTFKWSATRDKMTKGCHATPARYDVSLPPSS